MEHIIIIEDDPAISDLIKLNLELAGYGCRQAYCGQEAENLLAEFAPDLVLLDISLPDMEGYELLERFKRIEVPVIFLTARNALVDKVRGLKMGADDYIVKPFEAMELLARIEAVLRRFGRKNDSLNVGGLEIHLEERMVKKEGVLVELTMKEYELLLLLINNRNKALSREKILELVWDYEYSGETRTVDIHIQKIRKKLGWEERIKTVYKFGYRLEVIS
ncbi:MULTISPECIES: response regulator transcription factor [unclassified Paenibacillus]|uniref:response regulator transcription factor n=1 Tax=unclassified Paenibacillus TaxID=185978 RepID=UPI001046E46F|nr:MULTISPECIES: response regulator transcription factor [unclassified Paenibacillus]NIK71874.1 DNA-binding response OmpR family regulator [Paenibacillus sp. BK720]TCM96524.1 DNA-binding response OmpR family regulator [Paenibacillus sp. BK033]